MADRGSLGRATGMRENRVEGGMVVGRAQAAKGPSNDGDSHCGCRKQSVGNSDIKSCVETDKQAILKLKVDFTDDFGILSSWKHEADCCEWKGISCNRHVTKLHVPYNGLGHLEGKIDSSLCDLQYLTHLNLAFNDFGGSKIPKCIGSLNQLRQLNLSYAGLSGTIPHELRNFSNLQTLDIGHNNQLIVNDLE
ncbi:hypothetical protein K1719_011177 [Acacia pycnantha]|nr:hypothetical protein K1719_011177 [Acacia pycnantha]